MSTLILTEQNTQPQTPSVGKVKIYATNTNPPEIYLVDDAGNSYPLVSSFENILTFNAPLVRTVDTISISQASGGTDGYLSSTDWSTFNGKENVLTFNNGLTRTSNTVSIDYTRTGNVYTGNGLVSSPLFNFNGSLYTGGTSTTTKPFMLFEPNGTTSTNWSTAGTWLGINTATGFTGNFIHGILNNTEKFKFDYTGKLTITSADANINGLTIGKGNLSLSNNTAVGIDVLVAVSTGTANTGIGWRALYSNTGGEGNNGFGLWALRDNLTGSYNSGLGYTTLSQNTTGTGNSAIGRNALGKNLDGNYNTGIGYQAGGINTAGTISGTNYNTFIGAFTAENIGIGASNNIVIGYDIDLPTSTGTYQLVIGNLIYGTNISGSGTTVSSGGIGIGIAAVDASARLQVESTTKGFLPPRWTTIQKNAISSPATGLLGYDTDLGSLQLYNGSSWNSIATGAGASTLAAISAGSTTSGNSIYQMTSTIPVEFKTSDGNTLLYLDETNERVGQNIAAPLAGYHNNINGAASVSAGLFSGTPFAGTGTTSTPLFLMQEAATSAATTWSTAGTYFGVNARSGFGGDIINLKTNNVKKFAINSLGELYAGSNDGAANDHIFEGYNITRIHARSVTNGNVGFVFDNSTTTRLFDIMVNKWGAGKLEFNGSGGTSAENIMTLHQGGGVSIGALTQSGSAKLSIPVAPTASANYGLVSLGNGAWDGSTAGFFSGSANGTLIAGNLASGSTSDFLNLQKGGVSYFRAENNGDIYINKTTDNPRLYFQRSGGLAGLIQTDNGSGGIDIIDNTFNVSAKFGSSYIRLDKIVAFLGTTSSYPALKRNGTGLEVRLADDSDYSLIQASRYLTSTAGIVSSPNIYGSGTWYTGGTSTTTKPYMLLEPSGTTSTTWSTSGTGLGINAASGFVGNTLDVQINNSSKLKVTGSAGDVIISYRLGIAVSSVNNVLDVNGNTFIGNNGSSSNGTTRLFIKGSTSDTTAKNTSWLNSGSSEIAKIDNSGNFFLLTGVLSVGHSVIGSAQVHIQKTTEQLRIGYDVSNYYSTTVSSTGGVTFNAVGAGASFTFSDKIVLADAINIEFNSTTGTKIGSAATEKLSFWGVTPIVQITTGVTAATFVANTSGIADDTATFDGYTIGQIVKALRNIGILA